MDKRSFVLSYEESACTIDGLKGTLKTKKVEEKQSDGSLKLSIQKCTSFPVRNSPVTKNC